MKALFRKIRQILRDRRTRRIFTRFVSTIAAIVVFATTYALVLPAITLEKTAACGIEEHQHDDSCYIEKLICGLEESEGHYHDDSCYETVQNLTCVKAEHQHDETCYDEDGNLVCLLEEHQHSEACYEETRELVCGLEESEGHQHDSSCYEKVLTCGKEVHVHSTACYEEPESNESNAVVAGTSGTAVPAAADSMEPPVSEEEAADAVLTEEDGISGSDPAFEEDTSNERSSSEYDFADGISDGENEDVSSGTDREGNEETNSADSNLDNEETTSPESASGADSVDMTSSVSAEEAATAGTTGVLAEPGETEELSEGYVPALDPVIMDSVLTGDTGFYYYHPEEGEIIEDSSLVTGWKKADKQTELAPADLVRMYLSYKIPAGTLNETNQVARYRLPSNLHLTDDQIIAINQQENGIAASYIDYDTLQILDTDNYHKYLGAEAIEGTRTPDQPLTEGTQEYISAVVKAENVYDDEGVYGEKGAYLGQDLIFIFTPYTIEKNQNTYGTDGNPTSAGQKVSGWFACDFNMGQIDWVEKETSVSDTTTDFDVKVESDVETDVKSAEEFDNSAIITIEKTAEVIFTAENLSENVNEISAVLTMIEESVEEMPVDNTSGAATESSTEDVVTDNSDTDTTVDDNAVVAEDSSTSTDEAPMEGADTGDKLTGGNTNSENTTADETPEYTSGSLRAIGSDYTITLDYPAEAEIPADAQLKVREITAESDSEAYEECLEQAKASVSTAVQDAGGSGDKTTVDTAASRFFDIEIVAPVKTSAEKKEAGDATEAENANAATDSDLEVDARAEIGIDTDDTSEAVENTSEATEDADGAGSAEDTSKDAVSADSILSQEMVKIEPKAPVAVNIQISNKEEVLQKATTGDATSSTAKVSSEASGNTVPQDAPTVLHFADQGVETIESTVNDGFREVDARSHVGSYHTEISKDILFEADSFSIYGVVYTTLVTTYITASGETYEITVTYDADAQIPEGAELHVSEIETGTSNYDFYLENSALKLGFENNNVRFARFFEITISDKDGEKVEPKTPVQVKIEYKDAVEIGKDDALNIVHFAEEGTEIIEPVVSDDVWNFETNSFSVYGTIVAEASEDYSGRTFTISKGGNYLTSELIEGSNNGTFNRTWQFKKDSDSANAAVWEFEAATTSGQYNIFTYVDGVKKYMSMSQNAANTNRAHAVLSDTPQAFTVSKNTDGTHKFVTNVNGQNYWLNEDGNESGFAGWHQASSGTGDRFNINFTQPILEANDQYMVLVKIDDKYYIVLNNGELEETENPVNGNVNVVGTDMPMLWTYTGSNLYHPAEAVAYSGRNVASDYYYRYIDPRQDTGLSMDDSTNVTTRDLGNSWYGWLGLRVTSRSMMTDAAITYSDADHTITSANDSSIVLKVIEEDGKYKLAGGDAVGDVAEVYLAKFTNTDYLHIGERYHAVDHIDISVEAVAGINVPLAFGTYYYVEDGQVKTLVVSADNHVTLSLSKDDIPITKEDIKSGEIVAYKKGENGEEIIVPDAFTITGYSANNANGSSTDQVRIAGAFKVADLPAQSNSVNGNSYWREQRLANKIYYSVSTTKDVSFNMEYNAHQLYTSEADALASMQSGYDVKEDEKALKVNSMITLAASFDYWDSRNECPGIHSLGHTSDWTKGDIFCAEDDDPDNGNSGMDFGLGSAVEGTNSTIAIEITKYLVDSNDHLITPNRELDQTFHVYSKQIDKNAVPNPIDEVKNLDVDAYNEQQTQPDYSGYTKLLDKKVTVGDGGMGIVYDYDVSAGMVYIEEDKSEQSLHREITDINGKKWYYSETYLETEYVWRNDGIENRRHVSKSYSSETEAYNSIPDVLGAYKDIDGIDRYNGFLEFYVYNVYEPEPTDIVVEKIWKHQNGTVAEATDGARVTVTLGRYKLEEDAENPVTGNLKINQTITGLTNLPDGSNFQATYKVKRDGITVRTGSYSEEEGGALINGLPAGNYVVEITSSVEGYDVTNSPLTQNVTITNGQTTQTQFTTDIREKEVIRTVSVRVTNSIDGNSNYQDNTYTFPAGSKIAVNISRPGAGHNGSFHVTIKVNGRQVSYEQPQTQQGENSYAGITQILTFDLPQSGDTTIDIFHDWGRENLWINSVSLYNTGGSGLSSINRRNMPLYAVGYRRAQQGPLLLRSAATVSLAATTDSSDGNKIPDSPIPGMEYVVDSAWSTEEEPVTVELSGSTWRRVLGDLDSVDENGNRYLYFIKSVEEEGVPEGTEMTIDLNDGKILTSSGDAPLTVTNRIPNEPPKIKIKKIDENGMPMTGVKFSISKDGGASEEFEITSGDGVYTFAGLETGSYVVSETSCPEGYSLMSGTISFTVDEDYLVTNVQKPEGVDYDDDTLTFEVENKPVVTPGSIVVRKQWQDFYGNASDYDGTIDLKLVQWIPGEPKQHTVTFVVQCTGNGQDNNGHAVQYEGQVTELGRRTATGKGDVSIHWSWNQWTADREVNVTGYGNSICEQERTTGNEGNNNNNGGRTVTISNITRDLIVYITIPNDGYTGTSNDRIGNPVFTGTSSVIESYAETGGTKTVSLGTDGVWTQQFTVSGDGLLNDNSQNLPATYQSKNCYYTIAEESVPEGYSLIQISGDKIQSGVLTAYNRKTSVDVTLVKTDKNNRSKKLNNATFTLRQIDPVKTGNMDTRALDGGRSDSQTTTGEGDNQGKLSFANLSNGIYEIKETIAPAGYILVEDAIFYIKVDESGVQLLQMDETTAAESWATITATSLVTLQNGTATVGNEAGAELPSTGGSGTRWIYILGAALTLFAAGLLWKRKLQ